MKQLKDMTGWETRKELRELDKPELAQEQQNKDAFLRALAPKGYPKAETGS